MAAPLVSVVIPTFNRQRIIGAAIQSALGQTYPRMEVIVVDDGSTDDTGAVLRSFGEAIRVIRQENAGPSAARNRGVECAAGEIIAFLDSDDAWHPTKVARQVAVLESLSAEVPCCLGSIQLPHAPYGRDSSFALASLWPEWEEGLWQNPTEIFLTRFLLFNQAVAVRKKALEKAGRFDPSLRLLEDYDLALRLSTLGPWGFIRTPLVTYGTSEGNSLSRWGGQEPGRIPRVLQDVLTHFRANPAVTDPRLVRLIDRQLRACRRNLLAAELGKSGRPLAAVAGRGVALFNRVIEGLFRRSPGWPRMRVVPLSGRLNLETAPDVSRCSSAQLS